MLFTAPAFAQLTDTIKRAPTPDNAAIQRHVAAAVQNLSSDDADKQAKGRDDLAGGVVPAAGEQPASAAFLDAYAAAAAKALVPLTQHADMRVRLNAAIANARIAERAGNNRLVDVTVRFMNDKTSAVALWGVKAARFMLPAALGAGGNNPLLGALAQAVQRFMFGPIVAEIYDALSLNIILANPKPPPNVIKGAIPEMLRVFRLRVDSYGVGVPPDPAIDNTASEFLSFGPVWTMLTPPQRTEAVQAMSDLLSFAGQHAQFMEGEDRQTLMPIFKRTGAALQVIGDALQQQAVSNAAREVSRISTGMDGSEIQSKTSALTAALQKAVAGVKPSPQLPPPPEVTEDAPPPAGGAVPPNDGKAPPPPGGGAPRGGQGQAGPSDDAAQTAGETAPGTPAQGADQGAAPGNAAPGNAAPGNAAPPANDAKAPPPRPPAR